LKISPFLSAVSPPVDPANPVDPADPAEFSGDLIPDGV
jgi:hypothetical protein